MSANQNTEYVHRDESLAVPSPGASDVHARLQALEEAFESGGYYGYQRALAYELHSVKLIIGHLERHRRAGRRHDGPTRLERERPEGVNSVAASAGTGANESVAAAPPSNIPDPAAEDPLRMFGLSRTTHPGLQSRSTGGQTRVSNRARQATPTPRWPERLSPLSRARLEEQTALLEEMWRNAVQLGDAGQAGEAGPSRETEQAEGDEITRFMLRDLFGDSVTNP